LLIGAAARQLGRAGITLIAAATGVSKDTVGRGAGELEAGIVVDGHVRAKGAGTCAGTDKAMKAFEAAHLQRHKFHGILKLRRDGHACRHHDTPERTGVIFL